MSRSEADPGVAAVVLAAGAGTRLRPLTDLVPKPLCPVGGVPLLDHALARVAALAGRPPGPAWVAVNAHHHADQIVAHVGDRVHVSVEQPRALGTAGALGLLRPWIAGRPVLVTNADAYLHGALPDLLSAWTGDVIRLMTVADDRRADFAGAHRYAGVALMPWADVAALEPVESGLYELVWRDALAAGRVELVPTSATFVDCGTPEDYALANELAAARGAP